MPLSLKLHKFQVEVGHFIGESRGKLVPLSAIRERFKNNNAVSEAMWVLLEQKVIVEAQDYVGHYQLTRDGAAIIDDLHAKAEKEKEEAVNAKKADQIIDKVRRGRKPIADAAESTEEES